MADPPLEHVVIIVKENHTFDNYFADFLGANAINLTHAGDPVPDVDHSHTGWLAAVGGGGGQMSASANPDSPGRLLGYAKSDIPLYWDWAAQFNLCANYFTDVASQSEPNHLFMIAAESPIIDNAHPSRTYQPQPPYAMPGSLPEALAIAGKTWRSYGAPYFRNIAALAGSPNNESDPAKFDVDAGANTLAEVSWLYAPEGSSEHPGNRPVHGVPAGPAIGPGMTWTADRIKAILDGGAWSSTAIFLTWDDWGGWYDHVAAPENRVWQGGDPSGPGRKATYAGTQFRFGPRVPCLVISPYAKQGVNNSFCSHASLVKFCIRLFGLQPWDVPALAAGDPSGDMWDCFDFGTARADKPTVSQVPGAN